MSALLSMLRKWSSLSLSSSLSLPLSFGMPRLCVITLDTRLLSGAWKLIHKGITKCSLYLTIVGNVVWCPQFLRLRTEVLTLSGIKRSFRPTLKRPFSCFSDFLNLCFIPPQIGILNIIRALIFYHYICVINTPNNLFTRKLTFKIFQNVPKVGRNDRFIPDRYVFLKLKSIL